MSGRIIAITAEQNVRTAAWRILDSDGVTLGSVRHRHQVEDTARRLVALLWAPSGAEPYEVRITYVSARKRSVKRARES